MAKSITEQTPLLGPGAAQDPTTQISEASVNAALGDPDDSSEDKEVEWSQIMLLCYARIVEPIAFFSIFPFIKEMIQNTGIQEEDAGFYAGLIESLFSVTQMLLMLLWGKAADRVGRKPVLVFSLVGVSFATALFGLSTSVWQMIVFRCFAGVFAGSIVTIRAMISEHSTPKTQARAFSFFSFAGNLGIVIGPLIGGALSNPTKYYPGVFGDVQFFKDYPYALSCFVAGVVGITAAVTSALFIKETLQVKNSADETGQQEPPEMTTIELIRSPGVSMALTSYALVMLLALSYTAVIPVFQATSPKLGGLGLNPPRISALLVLAGVGQSVWTLFVFPPLQNKFGTSWVLKACAYIWPVFFATNVMFVQLLRNNVKVEIVYTVIGISQFIGSGVSMAFTGVILSLNDSSPNPRALGSLNGISLAMASGIRAFAPALFTSIFATGVKLQVLDGHLVWLVLCCIAIISAVFTSFLPKDKVPAS